MIENNEIHNKIIKIIILCSLTLKLSIFLQLIKFISIKEVYVFSLVDTSKTKNHFLLGAEKLNYCGFKIIFITSPG